jgi:hypothetical protein
MPNSRRKAWLVRNVGVATVEGNIDYGLGILNEPCCSVAQAVAGQVLMWGRAGDAVERAQEMVRTQAGFPRESL